MPFKVAEYLGMRTDVDSPVIQPVSYNDSQQCPFTYSPCKKVAKGLKPVCSLRDSRSGIQYIVCDERLCSSNYAKPLHPYQRSVLLAIARAVFSPQVQPSDLAYRTEITIARNRADYVLYVTNKQLTTSGPRGVVLEMQGGGDTSSTKKITNHVETWETTSVPSNTFLSQTIRGAGRNTANVWKRLQGQFLTKGSVAVQSCGGIVFCMGSDLYDHFSKSVDFSHLSHRPTGWNVAIIVFDESKVGCGVQGSLQLSVDSKRSIFTDHKSFIAMLVAQGKAQPGLFKEGFPL